MPEYKTIVDAIVDGDEDRVEELVEEALNKKANPHEIIDEGLIKGMDIVGDLWKKGELFIPEVMVSVAAMKRGMALVETVLAGEKRRKMGKVVMGTVKGDIHNIGKKIVSTLLESAGFEVVDLGVDVAEEVFVQKVGELKPDILGMSALLTTTSVNMKNTIEALHQAGLRDSIKIMVGGSAITPGYADKIGADGTAADAIGAVDLAKKFVVVA